MSETYVECLVKAKGAMIFKVLKVVFIILAVLGMVMVPISGIVGVLVVAAAAVGAYLVWYQADVEYEYLYLDKELTIDKILAQTKRKRVGVYALEKIEILAPVRSYHLDDYKNRQVKVSDYSIGEELQPDLRYAFYYEGNQKIIISPSEAMVKAMRNVAPRKIFMD